MDYKKKVLKQKKHEEDMNREQDTIINLENISCDQFTSFNTLGSSLHVEIKLVDIEPDRFENFMVIDRRNLDVQNETSEDNLKKSKFYFKNEKTELMEIDNLNRNFDNMNNDSQNTSEIEIDELYFDKKKYRNKKHLAETNSNISNQQCVDKKFLFFNESHVIRIRYILKKLKQFIGIMIFIWSVFELSFSIYNFQKLLSFYNEIVVYISIFFYIVNLIIIAGFFIFDAIRDSLSVIDVLGLWIEFLMISIFIILYLLKKNLIYFIVFLFNNNKMSTFFDFYIPLNYNKN